MIIHYLRVKNFCGITEKVLKPQTKGITIIEGPNEVGKSCFVRALYVLLEEPDSSMKRAVLATQPVDMDVGPEIEAEIESGPYRFRLFKRFVKDKATVLTTIAPTNENLKGREAHNRVQEILGKTMDMGLWKALNVIQGETVEDIPTNSSLSKALSNAAGTVTVGDLEMDLYESVKQEREKYYNTKGPTGDLKKKMNLVEVLEGEKKVLSEQLKRAEGDVDEISRLEAHLSELNQSRGGLEQEGMLRKEELNKAKESLRELELAEAMLAVTTSEHERFLSEVESRRRLEESIDKVRATLKGLKEGPDLEVEFEVAGQAYSEKKEEHKAAQQGVDDARSYRDLRMKDLGYKKQELWFTQLRERLERVEAGRKNADSAAGDLAHYLVTDDALEEITDAHEKYGRAKGAMETSFPSIKIEAIEDLDMLLDGSPIRLAKDAVERKSVAEDTTIELPGKLAISIHPGQGHDKLVDKHQKAEEKCRELFEKYNVRDVKEAYLSKQRRQDAQRRINEFEQIKKNDLRDLTIDGLSRLTSQTAEQVKSYPYSRQADIPIPADIQEAEEYLRKAEEALAQAERKFRDLGKELEKAERRRDKVGAERSEKISKAIQANGEMTALTSSLETSRRSITDEDLESKRAKVEKDLGTQTSDVNGKRAEAKKLDVPSLEALSTNADGALKSLDQRIDKTKERMDTIRGRLELYEQDGISEKLSGKERELCQARRELESVTRQAMAAKLLFDTMESEKNASQMRYLSPLKERIERLGRILYDPTFQVTLDENLNISSRTLDGKTLEFDQLSTGAKEQIGMISKLACAMIVSSEGGVPLILDDALGHTDPARIKAMDAILKVASKECQIILMTCYPSRYTGIGEAQVETMEVGNY